MCLVLSGCSKKTEETTNDISSVKLKSNQEIVACKITAIYGNEIEYTVVKEQSASDSNSKKGRMPSASGAPDMNGGSSQGGGAPDMNGGEMPQGGGAPDTNGVNSQSGGAADMNGESSQFEDRRNSSSDKNSSQSLLTVQIKSLTAANLWIKAARRFIHSRTKQAVRRYLSEQM